MVVGALNVESQCSWAAVPVFVTALTMWLGNEFEFRRPSLEREVQLDVCVHCSSCGTLRDVVHSPLVGSTIVVGCICVAESSGWSFTPDGTFDTVWDCVLPMFDCCFDEICADNYNSSQFKLKDKCRSEKWEVYLFGDKTIQVVLSVSDAVSHWDVP